MSVGIAYVLRVGTIIGELFMLFAFGFTYGYLLLLRHNTIFEQELKSRIGDKKRLIVFNRANMVMY